MKKINFLKLALPALALVMAASSCKPTTVISEEEQEARNKFMAISTPSFSVDGKTIAEYNQESDQIAYSEDGTEYLVSNLSFDKLYSITLSGTPELNAKLKANCSTVGLDNIAFEGREVTVIKVSDNKVWLWESEDFYGIVMEF